MTDRDQQRAPLLEKMRQFAERGTLPFSTPGHKLGAGADPELRALLGEAAFRHDIPLGGGIDDTHFHDGTLRAAEDLGAIAWGADRSFYLVNGSTAGNHAFLLAAIRPGEKVVVARDIHKSLLVALILSGAVPIYVAPRLHPTLNVGLGIDAADIAKTLDAHPDARLVVLVSPSYCGVASDLRAIGDVAHARDVAVFVDEAWGPHFHFHPALPPSAMASGADGAVASVHKVLGSLTQGSILHARSGRVDLSRLATTVGMAQTTSPSATILTSLDACRRHMALHGEALLERTIELAGTARHQLQQIPGVGVLDAAQLGITGFDATKLVIDVDGLGLSGFAAEEALRYRFRIQPEMSDLVGVVCLVTIGDTTRSIDRLVQAFRTLASERTGDDNPSSPALRSSGVAIAPGRQALSPRDAFFAPSRAVPLTAATDQIAAELVIPYPPGIPVLAPGDIISAEKIDYLRHGARHGMYLSGPSDPTLATIRVVSSPSAATTP